MPTNLDILHGLGPLTTVRRLDRDDLACLAGVLPAALPAPVPAPQAPHIPTNGFDTNGFDSCWDELLSVGRGRTPFDGPAARRRR